MRTGKRNITNQAAFASAREIEVNMDDLMPLILEKIARGQSVRTYPNGISMLPMLRPGVDSVILSAPPAKLRKYDLPLYRRQNGSYVLHRIIRAENTYTCRGDNQPAVESGVEHRQIIAVVTAFYRGDRYYTVKDPCYWIYCRLWPVYRSFRLLWTRGKRWIVRHARGLFRGE